MLYRSSPYPKKIPPQELIFHRIKTREHQCQFEGLNSPHPHPISSHTQTLLIHLFPIPPSIPSIPPPFLYLLLHQPPPRNKTPHLLIPPGLPRAPPLPPIPCYLLQIPSPTVWRRRGAVVDEFCQSLRGCDAAFSHGAGGVVPAGSVLVWGFWAGGGGRAMLMLGGGRKGVGEEDCGGIHWSGVKRTCPSQPRTFSISVAWRRGGRPCCRGSAILRRLGRRA